MECNSSTCPSGCYKDSDSGVGQERQSASENGRCDLDLYANSHVCIKCKVNETIAATHPAVASGGGDGSRFCADCFRGNLFGKFRFAVTSNAMISPSDNVLIAFSGGSSSRVALQFVHEMQHKAQKNLEASRDKYLPVFGVGVAYIDESANFTVPSHDFDRAMDEMKLIVSNLAPPVKQFYIVPIERIYSSDTGAGRHRLMELMDAVPDVTGKEDLLEHLRMLSLQKIAVDNGYTKLVLGTCTSRIACHVLEATVKGEGYSLAADIQYVDARWKIPVVLPLRDCISQELNMLCSLDSLKMVETFQQPRCGINGLISSFVKLLQEENPSRESTIVRTAGKLKPFSFNKILEDDDCNVHSASQRRQKKYNLKPSESLPPESFCSICHSPLKNSDTTSSNSIGNDEASVGIFAETCSSCQYQILPREPSSLESFHSLLPQQMIYLAKNSSFYKHESLRDQIQDCLLSDSEDGT
ncbi:cytoplasmic tRNA 2-thiolation 2 [Olea europaea subsp. europaea]|uniref:Cytoplasmic tRNA 2-thiolation protein 2 n=1 Tax=Olea europaea subsp. europaea TaxID=158383 RepID=A0A8S0RVD6_OLEEU|nr:cytoplasmic tRNA 2-thiolation 2 [Olea europaea subsp. europaea]